MGITDHHYVRSTLHRQWAYSGVDKRTPWVPRYHVGDEKAMPLCVTRHCMSIKNKKRRFVQSAIPPPTVHQQPLGACSAHHPRCRVVKQDKRYPLHGWGINSGSFCGLCRSQTPCFSRGCYDARSDGIHSQSFAKQQGDALIRQGILARVP